MVNNQENVSERLYKDVSRYAENNALAGFCDCCYHFNYDGINVEDLHNALVSLSYDGFNVVFDVCAHISVNWENSTTGKALEFKKIAKQVQRYRQKLEKKLCKKHHALVPSDNKFYGNIKIFLNLDFMEDVYNVKYIKDKDKEFLYISDMND